MTQNLWVPPNKVEVVGKDTIVVRDILVNRSRMQEEAIGVLRRKQYVDKKALKGMPREGNDKIDVYFFRYRCAWAHRRITDNELAMMYRQRGLRPDPYAQAAVHEVIEEFSDKFPNALQYKNDREEWCCAMYCTDDRRPFVRIGRSCGEWGNGYYWFSGVLEVGM